MIISELACAGSGRDELSDLLRYSAGRLQEIAAMNRIEELDLAPSARAS
jgi:hypothetical protein